GCSATSPPAASEQANATPRLIRGGSPRADQFLPCLPREARTHTIPSLAVEDNTSQGRAAVPTLHEVIDALAPLERRAGSRDEHRAAAWIAERLTEAGCETRVDEEQFLDGYARVIGTLAAGSAVAGLAALAKPA